MISYFLLLAISLPSVFGKTQHVDLSQKVEFHVGDVIALKDSGFKVTIGADSGTKCAVPGFNCGSGYRPPRPTTIIDCGPHKVCPYALMTEIKSATSGRLSIENEKSCETNDPENCFYEFARSFPTDAGCMSLKTPSGRYYCLKKFGTSARPENRGLCDELPESVYALRWNCFYEYAVRYMDVKFCDKYPPNESSGRDRCLLKMAEVLKDQKLCGRISDSREHSYREQCQQLEKR